MVSTYVYFMRVYKLVYDLQYVRLLVSVKLVQYANKIPGTLFT